jgi:uncharacterized DUF497 family protein
MALGFESDRAKAELNLKEHGVSFKEAQQSSVTRFQFTISDPDHSDSEDRFIDVGMSHRM